MNTQTSLTDTWRKRLACFSEEAARSFPFFMLSPVGVIPKHNRPDKWRLIVDLSSPNGVSVNDGLNRAQCSIKYTSIDDAVAILRNLGRGALMAKLDLKDAYRIVPIHPKGRPLLGMRWRDSIYIDCALPFGLRSAPKIFSALADGLMWIIHSKGHELSLHYLDDFLLLGPPGSPACAAALHTTRQLCEDLGIPIAEEKTEGPTTTLTFLGITIDSHAQQLRLPQEKLQELLQRINHWMGNRRSQGTGRRPRRSGTKRDLLSLIGLLNHAATVVRPGRTFLRSLIDASTKVTCLDHHVSLPACARADLAWWHTYLQSWNGTSLLSAAVPTHFIYSDASGSWGCGAREGSSWFRLAWPAAYTHCSKRACPHSSCNSTLGTQMARQQNLRQQMARQQNLLLL